MIRPIRFEIRFEQKKRFAGPYDTALLCRKCRTDNFLRSTIVPIPKGRNVDGSNSNYYRGIALSSIFGKLMDNIVLIKFSYQLQTSGLQFGFKAKSSTNLCTFVLRETLAYYVNNQTTMFCTIGMPQKPSTELIIVNSLGCELIVTCLHLLPVLLNLYIGNFVRISWCIFLIIFWPPMVSSRAEY